MGATAFLALLGAATLELEVPCLGDARSFLKCRQPLHLSSPQCHPPSHHPARPTPLPPALLQFNSRRKSTKNKTPTGEELPPPLELPALLLEFEPFARSVNEAIPYADMFGGTAKLA